MSTLVEPESNLRFMLLSTEIFSFRLPLNSVCLCITSFGTLQPPSLITERRYLVPDGLRGYLVPCFFPTGDIGGPSRIGTSVTII